MGDFHGAVAKFTIVQFFTFYINTGKKFHADELLQLAGELYYYKIT